MLDGTDCAMLGRQLVEALRLAYVARGRPAPVQLVDLADLVNKAARASAERCVNTQVRGVIGGRGLRGGADRSDSGQPVMLTVTEAARVALVSTRYMRELARKKVVDATRKPGGAWAVNAWSLAGWISRRLPDRERKAA